MIDRPPPHNRIYTPENWYWKVAGSTTQVYSSAAGSYVPVSDAAYQAWLATQNGQLPDGSPMFNIPSPIDSEQLLGDVLGRARQRPNDVSPNQTLLDAYKGQQADIQFLEVVTKVTFDLENRMRVLEGRPTVTGQQYKAHLKTLM